MDATTPSQRFNTRATFTLKGDRVYRVYPEGDELYFIRIAGQMQAMDWRIALNQLGLLGIWIGRKLNARRDITLAAKTAEADAMTPQEQLQGHKHSFHLHVNDVLTSSFDAPKIVSLHGRHAAVWLLEPQRGEKWRFQFEDPHEAREALAVLSAALGDRLTVNAVWDDAKEKFRKATTQDQLAAAGVA